jgi:hypothetical protein
MDKLADRDLLSILRESTSRQVADEECASTCPTRLCRGKRCGTTRSPVSSRHSCLPDRRLLRERPPREQVFADRYSGTISWALHALARHPQMQSKLRTECQVYGESLPFEQLDQLPYLDAVVMEVLRVYPSLPSTVSGIASLPRLRPLTPRRYARRRKTTSSLSQSPSRTVTARPSRPSGSAKDRSSTSPSNSSR